MTATTQLAVLLCALVLLTVSNAKKPNILFILADDLGYGDVNVYPNPNSPHGRLHTPLLDKFASESLMFTDAYAGAPVCSPSRFALMTGYHQGHIIGGSGNACILKNTSTTIASMLKDNGYYTALVGKWGLDGSLPTPTKLGPGFPTIQGFDYYYGQVDQAICHNYYPAWQWRNAVNESIPANFGASVSKCGFDYDNCQWTGDLWVNDTLRLLDQVAKNKEQPWYIFLSFTTPHAGSVGSTVENDVPVPRTSKGPYAKESWPKVEKDFATAVTTVDTLSGEVIAKLDSLGLEEDTIVMWSSDNGAHNEGGHKYEFFESSGPLNGFKRSLHEGGHRAAFMVRWPGKIKPGVTDQQFAFYDLLPTLADLAEIPTSAYPEDIDGYSAKPTMFGQKQKQPEFIYHEFGDPQDPVCKSIKALDCHYGQSVRMGNYTGVCLGPTPNAEYPIPDYCTKHPNGEFFLYDLTTDLGQKVDIKDKFPTITSEILRLMVDQHKPFVPVPPKAEGISVA